MCVSCANVALFPNLEIAKLKGRKTVQIVKIYIYQWLIQNFMVGAVYNITSDARKQISWPEYLSPPPPPWKSNGRSLIVVVIYFEIVHFKSI